MNLLCLIGKHNLIKLNDERTVRTGFTPEIVMVKGPTSMHGTLAMPDLPDWAKELYKCTKCNQVFHGVQLKITWIK